jgi:hypothetical protein
MNLERAILLVISASPRPVSPRLIQGHLPEFTAGDWTLADIERALKTLEGKHQVKGTYSEDLGTLWKETAEGKLRIA